MSSPLDDIVDSIVMGMNCMEFLDQLIEESTRPLFPPTIENIRYAKQSYYYLISNMITQFGISKSQILTAYYKFNGGDSQDAIRAYDRFKEYENTLTKLTGDNT